MVEAVMLWNEPNNPQFWAGAPDPLEYRNLLKEAVVAMRSADPSAIISSGGVSNLDLLFLSRARPAASRARHPDRAGRQHRVQVDQGWGGGPLSEGGC